MTDELVKFSARELADLIRRRAVSPVQVMEAHLRRVERLNPKLNAIVTLAPDALELAREAEAALMRGEDLGPLHGVPLTIKDTIETKKLRTTSGSLLRASHEPAEDAPAVARLKNAGAIILGKTNVSEMAIPYECDNPVFGRTNNPHDLDRTSGGSSGGEAAAISACMSPAGLGSDLSGSIRVPAHFCGIVGLKPTAGRVPVAGHFPPVEGALSDGAVLGPMARRVEDVSLLLKVLTGEPGLETSAGGTEAGFDLRGLRAGWFLPGGGGWMTGDTRRTVLNALEALGEAGLVVIDREPLELDRAMDLWSALFMRASSDQLIDFYRGQEESAGKLARAVMERGGSPYGDFLKARAKARAARDSVREKLLNWMKRAPLLIGPVGVFPAFAHGERKVEVDGEMVSVFRAFIYSRAANVLGFPAASVPAGRTPEGLPIGVQIIGRPFRDETVLRAARVLEASLGGWTEPLAE